MIYHDNLWREVLETPPAEADELKILSGYVGPSPIAELHRGVNAGMRCEVIFGLFKENRKAALHNELVKLHGGNVAILYPELPAHSKCYLWLRGGAPIRGLIGSANFSSNGLASAPHRESLMEVPEGDLWALKEYIELFERVSRVCTSVGSSELIERRDRFATGVDTEELEEGVAKLDLLKRDGELPPLSGINWGMSERSHVNQDDAYIPIRKEVIRNHPELFAPRPDFDGSSTRGSLDEVVELIWDDGEFMQVKFEGTQLVTDANGNAVKYPKQISSFPKKATMGRYLRRRIGVSTGVVVTTEDLERYGAHIVRLSKVSEGVYGAEFTPENSGAPD